MCVTTVKALPGDSRRSSSGPQKCVDRSEVSGKVSGKNPQVLGRMDGLWNMDYPSVEAFSERAKKIRSEVFVARYRGTHNKAMPTHVGSAKIHRLCIGRPQK